MPDAFTVPSDGIMLDTLGIEPAVIGDIGDGVREIRFNTDRGDLVSFAYDQPGRSIHVSWREGDAARLELFREGAERLSVWAKNGEAHLLVEFATEGFRGSLMMRLLPEITVNDRMLYG